jgi:hypothetical protein
MGHHWPSNLKEIGWLLLVFLVLKHARRGNPRQEGWAAWEAHRRLGAAEEVRRGSAGQRPVEGGAGARPDRAVAPPGII